MAFEYFLYDTLQNNTLVDRSKTTFAPLPPNTGEIYLDYFIPPIQPLYLYRESGGTIIFNSEEDINNYLEDNSSPPTVNDPINYHTFTGYTASTIGVSESIKFFAGKSSNQLLTSTLSPIINWSTPESFSDSEHYSWNASTGELTFLKSGFYDIVYNVTLLATAGNSRSEGRTIVQENKGSGFINVPYTIREYYNRQNNFGASTSVNFIREYIAGDIIRISGQITEGTSTISVLGDAVSLKIIKSVVGLNSITYTGDSNQYVTRDDFNIYTGNTQNNINIIESEINYLSGITDNKANNSDIVVTGFTSSGGTILNIVDKQLTIYSPTGGTEGNYVDNFIFTGYTASTYIQLNNIENDIVYISGQTDIKLNTSIFNSFTGTTLPANYYNKTQINSYTGATLTLINSKQNTITGAATTITTSNLTTNRAIISNGSGKIAISPTTSTQIGYLSGVTSSVQTQLNTKAPLASPTFTGVPLAPTAAVGTNTTQIATTAFVIGQAANTNPLMNGVAGIGTSTRYARQDHRHPVDTSRFAVTGGTITGDVQINKDLVVSGETYLSGITEVQQDISYGTPRPTALPSTNDTFTNTFVYGTGGPVLSNITSWSFNWDLGNNGLYNFSFNTNNGTPSWYVNLIPNTVQTFNQVSPDLTFSGVGIANFDGSYWINKIGSDIVLVSKTGTFAIYLTNNSSGYNPPVFNSTLVTVDSEKKTLNTGIKAHLYGTEFHYIESLGDSTTSSTSPQTKASLVTNTLPSGRYKIIANWGWTHTSTSNSARFDVQLNGVTMGGISEEEPQDTSNRFYENRVFYKVLSGINTINLRYWNEGSSTTIFDATIELIRVQ